MSILRVSLSTQPLCFMIRDALLVPKTIIGHFSSFSVDWDPKRFKKTERETLGWNIMIYVIDTTPIPIIHIHL